jgi:hypothetical protein
MAGIGRSATLPYKVMVEAGGGKDKARVPGLSVKIVLLAPKDSEGRNVMTTIALFFFLFIRPPSTWLCLSDKNIVVHSRGGSRRNDGASQ